MGRPPVTYTSPPNLQRESLFYDSDHVILYTKKENYDCDRVTFIFF